MSIENIFLDFKIENTDAASVEHIKAPNKNPSKIGNFKTKLQNIPTIKAVNKTPNVESTTA